MTASSAALAPPRTRSQARLEQGGAPAEAAAVEPAVAAAAAASAPAAAAAAASVQPPAAEATAGPSGSRKRPRAAQFAEDDFACPVCLSLLLVGGAPWSRCAALLLSAAPRTQRGAGLPTLLLPLPSLPAALPQDPVVARCGHDVCELCFQRWTVDQGKRTCPVCRAALGATLADMPGVCLRLQCTLEQLFPEVGAVCSACVGHSLCALHAWGTACVLCMRGAQPVCSACVGHSLPGLSRLATALLRVWLASLLPNPACPLAARPPPTAHQGAPGGGGGGEGGACRGEAAARRAARGRRAAAPGQQRRGRPAHADRD